MTRYPKKPCSAMPTNTVYNSEKILSSHTDHWDFWSAVIFFPMPPTHEWQPILLRALRQPSGLCCWRGKLDAPFPLTPALSLREREKQLAAKVKGFAARSASSATFQFG